MSNRRRKRERDKKYRKHLKFLEYHIGGYTPSASGNRELEELDWELAYDKPEYWKNHPKTYYFRTYPREGKRYQVHRKQSNISVRMLSGIFLLPVMMQSRQIKISVGKKQF